MTKINQFNSNEKIMSYHDKIDYFFNGHKTIIVAELDLTNRCNNKCPACTGIKENGAELSWKLIQKIVFGLGEVGAQGVIVSGGGEPLISPYFTEALELIRLNGMKVGLNSNGLALTEDKARAICKYCEYFRISLDAGTPEMYMKTHGMNEAAFNKVIENIKMFSRIKKETGSGVSFGAGFLTGLDTIEGIETYVRLVKECGVDFAQLRPFTGDKTDISGIYEQYKEKYETDAFKVTASTQKYKLIEGGYSRPYTKCRGMHFSTVITADAKMFACLHYRQKEDFLIGDIKTHTIPEIWRSMRKWQVYESIDCGKCPPFCRNDSFNRTLEISDLDVVHREFL